MGLFMIRTYMYSINNPFQEYITLFNENYSRYDNSWSTFLEGLTRFQKIRLDIEVTIFFKYKSVLYALNFLFALFPKDV